MGISQQYLKPETLLKHLLLAIIALHLLWSLLLAPRDYFSIDEALYHIATRDLVQSGSFFVQNGYETSKSPLLHYTPQMRITPDEHLAVQYPPLFSVLAAPFYKAFGYSGLFILNALSYAVALWLVVKLCRLLFGDVPHATTLSYAAALVYALGTYGWMYAQTAMSNTTGVAFLLWASCICWQAALADGRKSVLLALEAGFVLGLATLIRLDSAIFLGALIVPLMFRTRLTAAPVLAALAGMAIPLMLLGWLNLAKFGSFNPFSYGKSLNTGTLTTIAPHFFSVGMLALGFVLCFAWSRLPAAQRQETAGHKGFIVLCAVLLIGLVATLYTLFTDAFMGFVQNMRFVLLDLHVPANPSSYFGAGFEPLAVAEGGPKRALLQSCPAFALLALGLWWLFLPSRRAALSRTAIGFLLAACFSYMLLFGSVGLTSAMWRNNVRYLLPMLPFAAILCTTALYALWQRAGSPRIALSYAGISALAALALAAFAAEGTSDVGRFVLCLLPLLMAAVLLACLLSRHAAIAQAGLWLGITASLYSGFTMLSYDYAGEKHFREYSAAEAAQLVAVVPEGSLLVIPHDSSQFYKFFSVPHVRIAKIQRRESYPHVSGGKLVTNTITDIKGLVQLLQDELSRSPRMPVFMLTSRSKADATLLPRILFTLRAADASWMLYELQPAAPWASMDEAEKNVARHNMLTLYPTMDAPERAKFQAELSQTVNTSPALEKMLELLNEGLDAKVLVSSRASMPLSSAVQNLPKVVVVMAESGNKLTGMFANHTQVYAYLTPQEWRTFNNENMFEATQLAAGTNKQSPAFYALKRAKPAKAKP